jgi:membrane protein implicated in regulation of membrane protease activity
MDLNFRWKSTKQPASPRAVATFRYLFSALSLGFLIAAAVVAMGVNRFVQSAEKTTGTVVALVEKHESENNSITYAPVFTFTTTDGLTQSITSGISSSPASFSVGDRIPVLYRRDDPASAKVDSFWQLWFLPTLLAWFGFVAGTVGFAFLFTRRLQRAQQRSRLQVP